MINQWYDMIMAMMLIEWFTHSNGCLDIFYVEKEKGGENTESMLA